ncbi:MAG TPA: hypothetical protein VMS56_15155 [Thermoanaerobaculia bacterium]|nr:hypothetical protein [Thermoanaerobaculia bacterium]
MGVRGTSDDSRWEATYRYVDDQIDRATHRIIVMRQWTPAFKAGIEVNPAADEIGLVANWRIVAETRRRPAVILGTSSDRIGTPAGQSYYATFAKSLHRELGIPIAPYAAVSWSGAEDRFIFPFGVSVGVSERVSAMLQNDGVHTHASFTVAFGRRWAVTLLAIGLEEPGITIGTRF